MDGRLRFVFPANRGAPEQHVLAAAYAAGELAYSDRPPIMDLMRKAEAWRGAVDGKLIAHLTGRADGFASELSLADPVGWALGTLGFGSANGSQPPRYEVQQRFRELLRTAHPDTAVEDGFDQEGIDPADRIAELTEARRILLS